MGDDGYFEHSSVDGTPFWKRIGPWYRGAGYGHWSVGENLLWSSPDVSADERAELWMDIARASREHPHAGLAARSASPPSTSRRRPATTTAAT